MAPEFRDRLREQGYFIIQFLKYSYQASKYNHFLKNEEHPCKWGWTVPTNNPKLLSINYIEETGITIAS